MNKKSYRAICSSPREIAEFEEDGSDEVAPECPACGRPGVLLGNLGKRVHYRCRNCGMDFSHEEE